MTAPNLGSVAYCHVVIFPYPLLPLLPSYFPLMDIPPSALSADATLLASAQDHPPPGRTLNSSQHTASTSSHHGVLNSLQHLTSPIPLPLLMKSPLSCPLHYDLPSCRACRIPFASAPLHIPKYFLTWPSIGYLPPSVATTGPFSAPYLRTLSSPTCRLRIWARGPPIVPPFIDAYQCAYCSK